MWLWRWWFSDATARMPGVILALPINVAAAYLVTQWLLSGLVGGVAQLGLAAFVAAVIGAVMPAAALARMDRDALSPVDRPPIVDVPW